MIPETLNRTLLLMGDELQSDCGLDDRVAALVGTRILVLAGSDVTETVSGQTALVTAVSLMARSGHDIWIDAPEAVLRRPQPPLRGSFLLAGLSDLGGDLVPGCAVSLGRPTAPIDLVVRLGATTGMAASGARDLCLNAGPNWASVEETAHVWSGADGVFGPMATGALAASEAFKAAMRRLRRFARSMSAFDDLFRPADPCKLVLAPADWAPTSAPRDATLISGGAIGNAVVYALLRVPGLSGAIDVLDADRGDLSNLNRNALLRRSALGTFKVDDLARWALGSFELRPRAARYVAGMPLPNEVMIGVDDISARWDAQNAGPDWLGVGATAGWSTQVSSHIPGQPCAGCLHPVNAQLAGPIPTVAFVSFWAGLLLALRWLQADRSHGPWQQSFFSPLRPEGWPYAASGVAPHPTCPVGCDASVSIQAGNVKSPNAAGRSLDVSSSTSQPTPDTVVL